MDMPPLGLSQSRRHLLGAGIRHVLLAEAPAGVLPIRPAPAVEARPEPRELCEPWTGYLKRVPPSPKLVWTYWELGQDLAGEGDQNRSECWRRLIQNLGWPRGTVGFWPFAIFSGGNLVPGIEDFLCGLRRIEPRGLVVFGVEPLLACLEAELAGGDLGTWLHRPVHLAPSPSQLVAGPQDEQERITEELRRFYASLS